MTNKVDRDELLTVRQVLQLLGGVSRDTFYEWREKRTAPRVLPAAQRQFACRPR